MDIPEEVLLRGREAIATYKRALPYGDRWALMCALQTPPGTQGTDRAYMEGRSNNQQLDGLPERQARWLSKEAREAGINISGKYYCGGIADSRGWKDPEAWVSGVDDIRRVARKRNLHVEGAVRHQAVDLPPPRTAIAESIVRDAVAKEKRKNPRAKVGELREKILARHTYRVKGR